MRMTRLLLGRLCFKLSLCLAIAGTAICGLTSAPSFPQYHY